MGVGQDEEVDFQSEWRSRIHPDNVRATYTAFTDLIEGRRTRLKLEYRIRARNRKNWLWMHADAEATKRDKYGIALGLAGNQLDITDRKLAEGALRQREQQSRCTMMHAPIATAIEALDGTWIAVNPASYAGIWVMA